MKKFVCTVCGYVHEGETAPEVCPVCGVGADKFVEQAGELVFADEHRIGVAQGVGPRSVICSNRQMKKHHVSYLLMRSIPLVRRETVPVWVATMNGSRP